MQFDLADTIAAQASAPGPAVRAIVRVTGPQCQDVVRSVFQPTDDHAWKEARLPRQHRGSLNVEALPELEANCLLWPGARSYTGQPMAELHMLGAPPFVDAVLAAIYESGARAARAGEFTLRSFLAGRIDLVQAEAVLGVIDSEDHVELEKSLRQLAGGISSRLGHWRSELLNLLADLEAGLDFVDEDIEFVPNDVAVRRIAEARDEMQWFEQQASSRIESRDTFDVVLFGLPNAGKSTLLNALADSDVAIVSEISGTTRDYVTTTIEWRGMSIRLIDTAGWETGADQIMQRVAEIRSDILRSADLILLCRAADDLTNSKTGPSAMLEAETRDLPLINVRTKVDLAMPGADGSQREGPDKTSIEFEAAEAAIRNEDANGLRATESIEPEPRRVSTTSVEQSLSAPASDELQNRVSPVVECSALTGVGVEALKESIIACLSEQKTGDSEIIGATAARCRDSLRLTSESLGHALEACQSRAGDELVTMELRTALEHLGAILGEVYTDDVLDRVFSRFCIGK